jgi:hypothetical protein
MDSPAIKNRSGPGFFFASVPWQGYKLSCPAYLVLLMGDGRGWGRDTLANPLYSGNKVEAD